MSTTSDQVLKKLLPAKLMYTPVRITTQGSMAHLIKFALEQLEKNDESPLSAIVLHTLPAPPASDEAVLTSTQPTSESAAPPAPDPTPTTTTTATTTTTKKKVRTASVDAIPTNPALSKLISIAEIIKRTWLAREPSVVAEGKGKERAVDEPAKEAVAQPLVAATGLHQYNYLGALEQLGLAPAVEQEDSGEGQKSAAEQEKARQDRVAAEWLSGKAGKDKRPRMRHTPFLMIVLSPRQIHALARLPTFSYQPPVKPSKQAAKNKRRAAELGPVVVGDEALVTAVPVGGAMEVDGSTAVQVKKKRKRSRKGKAKAGGAEGGQEHTAEKEGDIAPRAEAASAAAEMDTS